MPDQIYHCPICSTHLLLNDDHPEIAYCPKNHYVCQAADFNRLWDEFNVQVELLGLDQASAAYAEKLLKDLLSLNSVKKAKAK